MVCSAAPFLESSGVWAERNVLALEGREGIAKGSDSSFLLLGLSSRAMAGAEYVCPDLRAPARSKSFKISRLSYGEIFKTVRLSPN